MADIRQFSRETVWPCFWASASQIAQWSLTASKTACDVPPKLIIPRPSSPATVGPEGDTVAAVTISMVGSWYGGTWRCASFSENQSVFSVTHSARMRRTITRADSSIISR